MHFLYRTENEFYTTLQVTRQVQVMDEDCIEAWRVPKTQRKNIVAVLTRRRRFRPLLPEPETLNGVDSLSLSVGDRPGENRPCFYPTINY